MGSIRLCGLLGLSLWVMSLALLVGGSANAAAGRTTMASTQAAVHAGQATASASAAVMAELSKAAIETADDEAAASPAEPEEEPNQAANRTSADMAVPFKRTAMTTALSLPGRRLYCGRAPPGRQ